MRPAASVSRTGSEKSDLWLWLVLELSIASVSFEGNMKGNPRETGLNTQKSHWLAELQSSQVTQAPGKIQSTFQTLELGIKFLSHAAFHHFNFTFNFHILISLQLQQILCEQLCVADTVYKLTIPSIYSS